MQHDVLYGSSRYGIKLARMSYNLLQDYYDHTAVEGVAKIIFL